MVVDFRTASTISGFRLTADAPKAKQEQSMLHPTASKSPETYVGIEIDIDVDMGLNSGIYLKL